MIASYLSVPRYLKISVFFVFMMMLIFYGYYGNCMRQLQQVAQQHQKNKADEQTLIQIKNIISQKALLERNKNSLLIEMSYARMADLTKIITVNGLRSLVWHQEGEAHGTLILDGTWPALKLFWQQWVNEYTPWQLDSFEINTASTDNNLQLKLYFNRKDDLSNAALQKKEVTVNPFSKEKKISGDSITIDSLHWLGALQIDQDYIAYAMLPNHQIISFKKGSAIESQSLHAVAVDLNHITFEDASHRQYFYYFKRS